MTMGFWADQRGFLSGVYDKIEKSRWAIWHACIISLVMGQLREKNMGFRADKRGSYLVRRATQRKQIGNLACVHNFVIYVLAPRDVNEKLQNQASASWPPRIYCLAIQQFEELLKIKCKTRPQLEAVLEACLTRRWTSSASCGAGIVEVFLSDRELQYRCVKGHCIHYIYF